MRIRDEIEFIYGQVEGNWIAWALGDFVTSVESSRKVSASIFVFN